MMKGRMELMSVLEGSVALEEYVCTYVCKGDFAETSESLNFLSALKLSTFDQFFINTSVM